MKTLKNLVAVALIIFLMLSFSNIATKQVVDFYDPSDDSKSYISLAKSLQESNTFVRQEFINKEAVETVRTPGYSLFLSLFSNLKYVIYIQNILHMLSAILLLLIIQKNIDFRFSYMIFLLYLFHPLLASLSQLILTETISIFLINLVIYFLVVKNQTIIPIILISILPLIRPAYLIIMIGVVFFNTIFFKNLNLKERVLVICVLILPTTIWINRNYQLTEEIIFSSITGMNLLEETASGIKSINEDLKNNETFIEVFDIKYEEKRYWSQILRNDVELGDISRVISNAPGANPHKVVSAYQNYAMEIIIQNPFETIILATRAFLYNTLEPGDQIYDEVFNLDKNNLINFLVFIFNFVNTTFAFIYFLKSIKRRTVFKKSIIFYILMIAPLLLLATPSGRFGAPLISITLLLSTSNFKKVRKPGYIY
jgi:hypothetical protein|tara:strand:+ start:11434 stop:12711 length:1278 start_codon:yes stop_codon:yes gene_type:complete